MTMHYTEACTCPDRCLRHPAKLDWTQAERLRLDLTLFGNAYTVDGKRVPPEDVIVLTQPQTVDNLVAELGADPYTPTTTQDEFLTMLDELLDNTLHDDHCYIDENDTTCVCIIGAIRAALPPCGAVKLAVDASMPGARRTLTCHRNAHPASPDRHVF